uniref:Phytocyanin domain-containing protein n=1 Tax=Solanum lycopersicum TaxID=4081 RepID=A0A3Q7F919_SOLLC
MRFDLMMIRSMMLLGLMKCAASGLDKVGDFVFDKHYYSVLEVNQTNYEQCIDSDFISNITRGGRDVFHLTQARPYYFISSGGYCFHGMKLAINVEQPLPASPAPSSSNKTNASPPQIDKHLIISAFASSTLVWMFLFAQAT